MLNQTKETCQTFKYMQPQKSCQAKNLLQESRKTLY